MRLINLLMANVESVVRTRILLPRNFMSDRTGYLNYDALSFGQNTPGIKYHSNLICSMAFLLLLTLIVSFLEVPFLFLEVRFPFPTSVSCLHTFHFLIVWHNLWCRHWSTQEVVVHSITSHACFSLKHVCTVKRSFRFPSLF